MVNWICDKIKDFSGENIRREALSEINEKKNQFEVEVTELIEVLNSVVNIIDKRTDIEVEKVLEKDIIFLKEFIILIEELNEKKNFFAEDILLLTKNIDRYDWNNEKVFKDTFKNGLLKQRRNTHNLNKLLKKRRRMLELEIEYCRQKLEECKKFANEEIEINDLYENVIKMITEIIKEKTIPEIIIIKEIIANKSLISEAKSLKTNENLIMKYNNKDIFAKNIFMLYEIAEKVCNQRIIIN